MTGSPGGLPPTLAAMDKLVEKVAELVAKKRIAKNPLPVIRKRTPKTSKA